jgi:pristinamycin I synthase-3/4
VTETAAAYVREIRRAAPRGPYHLLGWSAGGTIAHEMAVQLQAAGEQVGLLAVLDGYPLAGLAPASAPSPKAVAEAVRRETAGLQFDDAVRQNLTSVYLGVTRAVRTFTPGVFRGELLHFAAAHGREERGLAADLWQPHLDGRMQRHEVACSHEEMTQPQALAVIGPTVAARLQELIASAQHMEGTTA